MTGTLTGVVLDDASGAGLANADVVVEGSGERTATDQDGHYTLQINGAPRTLAVSIQAAGHAPHRQYMQAPKAGYGHLQTRLRAFELQQTVNLPEAGAAALQVSLKHATANMGLRIEAGDMVRADGTLAHGTAQVNVAFWHPLEPLGSAPGMLLAGDANLQRLKSWGMADIEVRQDGALLQVAANQLLEWTVQLPDDFGQARAALPPHYQPDLYYLDPNTGLWRKDGMLSFDANQTLFTGSLPHLSSWNIDSLSQADGGCVQGRVLNKCGKPAANLPITVWFLGDQEVKDFPLTADAQGRYCLNTGVNPSSLIGNNPSDTTTHYRVSGGGDMLDSSQCNPLPSKCMPCNQEPQACNSCDYGAQYNNPHDGTPACEPPALGISGCNWCPGTCPSEATMDHCAPAKGGPGCVQQCEVLQDVVVSDPTCDGGALVGAAPQDANAAANPNAVDPNSVILCAKGPKNLGDTCEAHTQPCCNPTLECDDFVCVPLTDEQ